jgi:hypothetical protein
VGLADIASRIAAAGGVRIQPHPGLPLWFTAERRHQFGTLGLGRNVFALFAEGGVWQRPMPWRFEPDAYLQGGVVGFRRPDPFVDGGLTVTRPVYKQFAAGLGVWGAAQRGVQRLDAGPRVSMKVRPRSRAFRLSPQAGRQRPAGLRSRGDLGGGFLNLPAAARRLACQALCG